MVVFFYGAFRRQREPAHSSTTEEAHEVHLGEVIFEYYAMSKESPLALDLITLLSADASDIHTPAHQDVKVVQ